MKMMQRLVSAPLALALGSAVLLAGCGKTVVAPSAAIAAQTAAAEAQATATLQKAYRNLYTSIFTRLDASQDGRLDEYEASAAIDVADFRKADRNNDGKLTKTEFIGYADGSSGTFGFLHQSADSFLKQARAAMQKGFTKLDKNGNRYLETSELSDAALKRVDMNLKIPALHVNVHITELDEDVLSGADHTEDGKLTQAEWEDYCVSAFIKQLNPNAAQGGSGGGSDAPADDAGGDSGDEEG